MLKLSEKIRLRRKIKRKILYQLKKKLYLEKGIYRFIYTAKPCFCKLRYEKYIYKEQKKRMVDGHFFGQIYYFSKVDDSFNAQFLMKLKNDRYKFFDVKNRIVLNLCSDRVELKNIHYFSRYFQTPYIKETKDGFIEKYIDYIPRSEWKQGIIFEVYEKFLRDFIKYAESVELKRFRNYENFEENVNLFKDIFIHIKDKFYADELPCIFTHGDMSFYNILYCEDTTYYIDFADAREEEFIYDVFNVMYVEYIEQKSSFLLDLYLGNDNRIIKLISRLFSIFQVKEFNLNQLKGFIYRYLILRINYDVKKSKK